MKSKDSVFIHRSHNVSMLMYHFVFVVKYRKLVIVEEVDVILKEICLEISKRYDITFFEIGAEEDHIHFLVQSIPTYSPTKIATIIKSLTARQVFALKPDIRKQLWGGEFWSNGYFVATVGGYAKNDLDAIQQYIRSQGGKSEYHQLHKQ